MNKTISLLIFCVFAIQATASDYEIELYSPICEEINSVANYDTDFLKTHWQIFEGRNGWLINSNLDLPDYRDALPYEGLRELKRLQQVLASKGTQLMLLFVPARGIVYPQNLITEKLGYDSLAMRKQYTNVLNAIRDADIIVPDLDEFFHASRAQNLFYKADVHWTIEGAKFTAKKIGDSLKDAEILAFEDPLKSYETQYNGVLPDLKNIQTAVEQICNIDYGKTFSKSYITSEVTDNESFSLVDESSKDIVLIGTSFSARPRFNFTGYIQQELNRPVISYAVQGGGVISAWINYLKSNNFHSNPPKLIIWEVSGWRIFESRFFDAFTPYLHEPCNEESELLRASVANVGTKGAKNALFSPMGVENKTKNLLIKLAFDSPHIDSIGLKVWFANGTSKSYKIDHQFGTANDGRFLMSLGNDHQYRNENVVGVDIANVKYFHSAGEKPSSNVTVSLCSNPIPYSD